jgi:hypothetical protein
MLELGNYIVHIVFLIFPFLWSIGILPQVDVFWLWILEQILVFCFGGTTSLDDTRLTLMLSYSVVGTIIVFILYNFSTKAVGVAVAAGLGYLLSVGSVWHYTSEKKVFHCCCPLTIKGKGSILGLFSVSSKVKLVLDVIVAIIWGGLAFILSGNEAMLLYL